ncbi:hypothetical protein HYV88_04735 [Candidatus Woesearchaeota archaeon]|nr:hypothetical protein [Candidatus Woesearchaeota archaeon]
MIEPNIVEKLDIEIDRLRVKYKPKSTDDLERIARNEFGVVNVIKTPMVNSGRVVKDDESGLYIFCHAELERYGPLVLGHEIGHIVAGHLNGHRPQAAIREEEADYFSAGLNDISLHELNFLRLREELRSKGIFFHLFGKRREVKRLQQMGVYHLLTCSSEK